MTTPVVVVGGGIAGVAAASSLAGAGVPVRVLDRGRRLGGRLAVRTRAGRPIDVGAAYFVARDPAFAAVVSDWERRGLARQWTDTFHVADPTGLLGTATGPVRWAAARGLRSLVEDLVAELPAGAVVEHPVTVTCVRPTGEGDVDVGGDVERLAAAVLAMPDPQARAVLTGADAMSARLRAVAEAVPWEPALALVARFDRRRWPAVDGVFVNESPVLTFVADDGARRGDGAPVLVAHSTPEFAAAHLARPDAATAAMVAAVRDCLGIDVDPDGVEILRWTYSRPAVARPEPCLLDADARIALAGDGWHDGPRTECAWLSGREAGRRVAALLR